MSSYETVIIAAFAFVVPVVVVAAVVVVVDDVILVDVLKASPKTASHSGLCSLDRGLQPMPHQPPTGCPRIKFTSCTQFYKEYKEQIITKIFMSMDARQHF